jgi:pimeloyl-ACP methyl ester carboxylesterase
MHQAMINARRYGPSSGPLTVVVPGLAVSRYLRPASAALADATGAPVWLVDPPGFGGSDQPAGQVSVAAAAAGIMAWLSELRQPVTRLLGQSTGCLVAATMADPCQVEQLVLCSPVVDPTQRSVGKLVASAIRDAPRESPRLAVEELPQWWQDRRRLWPYLRSCLDTPLERLLDPVAAAVTVVRGDRDPLSRPAWAAELAERGDGSLVTVPGGSHTFMYTQPELLVRALR